MGFGGYYTTMLNMLNPSITKLFDSISIKSSLRSYGRQILALGRPAEPRSSWIEIMIILYQ
jgi:hypothetical protein